MNIFIIPHAGGSKIQYRNIEKALGCYAKVYVFEFRGHGTRANESPYLTWNDVVNECFDFIYEKIKKNEDKYVLCGNSMGAYIVNAVQTKIRDLGVKKPSHIFYAACNPNANLNVLKLEALEESCAELCTLKGTRYYSSYVLPILENDLKILKTADNLFKEEIDSAFTVLYGKNDNIVKQSCAFDWHSLALGQYEICYFEGNHMFFCNNELIPKKIMSIR